MIENKKSEKANLENKKNLFFLIGLVLALSVVLYAFEWKTQETNTVIVMGATDFGSEEYIFIPRTSAEKIEIPKPVIEVPDFEIVDNEIEVEEFDFFISEPDDISPIDFSNLIFQSSENNTEIKEEIINFAEVMPEFPGGERALVSYLARNVKYPVIAQENGIEGKVYISFVVDKDGSIFDVNIVRGVDASLDNEALRVVKTMPKWMPGKQGGKAVRVRYNVPINFDLR